MNPRSVKAVVFNTDRTLVLLHKREDFHVWDLPGGLIEPDEAPADAAARETHEETGYVIDVQRLAGEYYRPQVDDTLVVFEGIVTGGAPLENGAETLAVEWFPVEDLPDRLIPATRQYVEDVWRNPADTITATVTYPGCVLGLWQMGLAYRELRKWWIRRKLQPRHPNNAAH